MKKTTPGRVLYKLNKNVVLIFLLLNLCNLIFALSEEDVRSIIRQKTSYSDTDIEKIYSINNDYSVVFIRNELSDKHQLIFLVSDNKAEKENFTIQNETFKIKYLNSAEKINVLCGDVTFDEKSDIFWIRDLDGFPAFEIYEIDGKSKDECFCLIYPDYFYGEGANPRINGPDYLKLNDFKFCIVNGKRGLRAYSMGKLSQEKDNLFTYFTLIDEDKSSKYFFFYWDKSTQRYILDESVTQEQIKNAYCPEDYFACNGLKFSKLESKLTDEDLKDLDKAQLRLMRNAVYARRGRTFKSVDLQSLFDCYIWYRPDDKYSDELLTDVDKYNIELIQKLENK